MNKVLVFASGSADGGGSGFEELVEQSRLNPPILKAEVVGVVSNHPAGGVQKKAGQLKVPFKYWSGPFDANGYREWVRHFRADFVMLSGWLKKVEGLNPRDTVNIHPGPLSRPGELDHFGGKGLYGHHVHEAVMKAYRRGEIAQSAVSMHFVTGKYDEGPIIVRWPVAIRPDDTPETLAARVNEKERAIQSWVLNLVVQGRVKLNHYDSDNWYITGEDELKIILPGNSITELGH